MTEQANNGGAASQNEQGAQFSLQRIYVRDLSFEAPKSPEIFRQEWNPSVALDLNTKQKALEGDFHEVVLTLSVTVKTGEEVAFIAEVQQAGIFLIKGLEAAAMSHTLGAFCPNILFPYAREALDSLVTRGSFPALMLAPVNSMRSTPRKWRACNKAPVRPPALPTDPCGSCRKRLTLPAFPSAPQRTCTTSLPTALR
jgi:preprotein translocase subunit SecB